jgi:hypothetical protein
MSIIIRSVVVFPAPFSPINPVIYPSRISSRGISSENPG